MLGKRVAGMKISIRKLSFFEIVFPLTVVFFVCIGTSFVDDLGASNLRWVFVFLLFLYLFLNKKLFIYINYWWKALLLTYLVWCMSTALWSQVPLLSFSKSALFTFNIIVLLSTGSLWIIKYGYDRSSQWLFLILVVALASGLLGGASAGSFDSYGSFSLYSGLNGNANAFGFLVAIVSPLIFLKLYQNKMNRRSLFLWILILILDIHFLTASYSRSSFVIFSCVLGCFTLSLPLSRKILVSLLTFFCIAIVLLMMPVSYLESMFLTHIVKLSGASTSDNVSLIFQSRRSVWQQSIARAEKGGWMGAGFGTIIGDTNFSDKGILGQVSAKYGYEKGNSQLAIMEETGIIGLALYTLILVSFFCYAIPCYRRLQGGEKVAMGTVLGAIVGLIMESLVEGWWNSAAGPEVICFWTFVGIIFGMIYVQKRKSYNVSTE